MAAHASHFHVCGTLAGEPSFIREVSRTVGVVADVAEGAETLAGAVNFAAANATVAVTTTAADIATSSLSLAREAWLGVDLLNVSASRSHGRMIAESVDEVGRWAAVNPTFANMTVRRRFGAPAGSEAFQWSAVDRVDGFLG